MWAAFSLFRAVYCPCRSPTAVCVQYVPKFPAPPVAIAGMDGFGCVTLCRPAERFCDAPLVDAVLARRCTWRPGGASTLSLAPIGRTGKSAAQADIFRSYLVKQVRREAIMLETVPIIIQTIGGTDWPAITASISTGVAAVAGIGATLWQARRGSDVQLQIAREQRIAERQIDTYLEILEWIWRIRRRDVQSSFDLMESIILPEELELKATAFAVGEIRRRVDEFISKWIVLQNKLQRDEAQIRALVRVYSKTQDNEPLFAAVPEWRAALDAMEALHNSIRIELLGNAAHTDQRR